MKSQLELFTHSANIPMPLPPKDTRLEAKQKVNTKRLRQMVAKSLYEKEMTADEWARENNVSILNARPRFSELNKKGMLWHHGYGLTADGNKQNRYTLYPYIKTRIQLLACKFGIEKAIAETLTQFGL